MMSSLVKNTFTAVVFLLITQFCSAQNNPTGPKKDSTPYRILEHKDVNASDYNFRITVNEKIFFVMLQMADGKVYSEKIGIQ